ncbi:MAG: RidA family protein [Acidimicrobiaceae bacterium]|nr:RidA family protein [Acidimicrobiaceae bacterium]
MGQIEDRITAMGLALPPPVVVPPDVQLPFAFVNICGNRAIVSGHGPQGPDGTVTGPFGIVGHDISVDQGYESARLVALSMLGSLHRELGTLDRISHWVKALGMVRCGSDFTQQPAVINGFSDLILELFGPDVGRHSRSAVGMTSLPFGIPVEIEAEVLLHS